MSAILKILQQMRDNPEGVRYMKETAQ